jgi:hypothetical protein
MKTKVLYLILAGVLLLFTAQAALARVEAYSVDWWTVDGGGGSSANAPYSLSGTVGQPDAGTMSGGFYSLSGGFWGGVASAKQPGFKIYLPWIDK